MTAATIAMNTRRRVALRRRVNMALAIIVVGTLALPVVYLLGGKSSDKAASGARTFTSADHSFSISYPKGWSARAAKGPAADAVIARADGRGLVVVRSRGAVTGSLPKLARDLGPQLKRRFKDFKPVSARIVRLSSGPALSYTFIRTSSAAVQAIVIVPAGRKSYTIETVAPGDGPEVAQQLGAIVRSFKN